MSDSNEQWLLDGICRECRRRSYCSKPCKRNKVRTEREIMTCIYERTEIGVLLEKIAEVSNKE